MILLDNIGKIVSTNFWVEHTHEVKNQILKVQINLVEAENAQRGFLLTEKDSLLKPLTVIQRNAFKEIDTLKFLTKDNKEQQEIIKKLKNVVSLRYQTLYATIEEAVIGKNPRFLQNAANGNKIMDTFIALSNQMDRVESKLLEQRKQRRTLFENLAPLYLKFILFLSCIVQIASFILILYSFKRSREYRKTLENKVKELNIANSEMEQIAFVVSHDLQEPLRKIRTFSDKLLSQHKNDLNEEGKIVIGKMSVSARRMQDLLNDLINYTHITKSGEKLQLVDLKKCFNEVCKEFQNAEVFQKAIIKVEELPVINGYADQLRILIYNLIDNALKFSKPGVLPVISISATLVTGTEIHSAEKFNKISISDNGIGFDRQHAEKIFIIFQRLHTQNSPFQGKGIGLSICKRIMINHQGFITASGETGIGATFHLYFPENPS